MIYRVKDWNTHFENNKSREREKCSFCCIPNKQDGLGYGLLMREPDGESLYGAFVAIILILSKQRKRDGYLTANGLPAECPLSARQLSIKCHFTEATIQRMLDVCSSPEIGWIERLADKCPPSARRVPAECPSGALKEGKKEVKEDAAALSLNSPPDEAWIASWVTNSRKNGSDYSDAEARSAYLALSANGWMWGRNHVTDYRSAIERQIQTDRQRNAKSPTKRSKVPNL